MGVCHSHLGITLFPKMGIPSRPKINGTVGPESEKTHQYSRKPGLVIQYMRVNNTNLRSGLYQRRRKKNFFLLWFCWEKEETMICLIWLLCFWMSDQEELAHASRPSLSHCGTVPLPIRLKRGGNIFGRQTHRVFVFNTLNIKYCVSRHPAQSHTH